MASSINVTYPSGVSTYFAVATEYEGQRIYFSGVSLYQVDDCKIDYAVLYLNAYGGWDVFGFPVGKKTENFE